MDDLLFANIAMALSALLPAVLLKSINPQTKSDRVGYRTPRSLKSPETKEFANRFASNAMLWVGMGTIAVQLISYFLVGGSTAILITAGVMTTGFLGVLVLTERELRARFDEEGKPNEMRPRY